MITRKIFFGSGSIAALELSDAAVDQRPALDLRTLACSSARKASDAFESAVRRMQGW
jgi:hypothetical protein